MRKISLSRYAESLLAARPELAAEPGAGAAFAREEMAAALAGSGRDDEAGLKRRLRRLRQRVLLRVMSRDLDEGAPLAEVCGAMSDLAELEIAAALDWTRARDLVVIAMGKLGGRELNVSSDVDLVFAYATGLDPEPLERAGRRLIRLLSEVTEDGFAFRVDMRLRPYGDSGPLASSFDALEAYFLAQGREWERYAWIKARPLTGTDHAALAAIVRPFVYRKYLDYGTLAAMRRLHAEVRRDVARRDLAEHVKLGPGGIREIEFVVQALQLVRGGREPALAVRPTLEALARLAERKLLPAASARELSAAYDFLRRTEHRLQYLDDQQTHTLPADPGDRERIARMSDFPDWDAFYAALQAHREAVQRHFQDVFAESAGIDAPDLWQDDRETLVRALGGRGFRNPEMSAERLLATRRSQRYAVLPADSRQRFDALVPALAAAAARTDDPEATLARGLDLIEAVARRAAYLALLAEHPEALERVTRIVAASSWAADYVTRHPLLLDELLDDRVLYEPPDWAAFAGALRSLLAEAAGDVERQMNVLREQHQAMLFRLLAQDLAGLLSVEHLADHLSQLADLVLEAAIGAVWAQIPGRHREAPRFAVIGYGKLGGKELGYASDLDLIFLHDDPDERAPELYARLAQRLNHWLTARTASGVLFETDLRLRPSGEAGLLVTSLEAFYRYQEDSAWVWEHQALTRARHCAGDAAVGAAFEALRTRILVRPREPGPLAAEVLKMRERMHEAHPNRSGLFDVKHDRGGMIDVEFAVQYLVLAHARACPDLARNLGNIALLGMAAEHGLVPEALAGRCRDAYRAYRRLQHGLRLNGAQFARVPRERAEPYARAVRELWALLFG
ncbi:MAG TPA: bifunctional [glutamate--ammonia ligase]-adenylyl-L-tyrosine phosphorylase/[glutamate--ammonia-ligase] adenylyltransferase [Burkholderiales bacterium]|nr:bifunctional [glutamate--ammonia ligase]-adenylyl-L-tyrosine phosphorylase/[glutamate--ammonia-ligase] adenylyltransferase [Burkholderiales bacterium]